MAAVNVRRQNEKMSMKLSIIRAVAGVAACAALLGLPLTGQVGTSVHAASRHSAAPTWLSVNAKTHTATLTLIAAYTNALSGFNFNGYGQGKMVVTIPNGYKVAVVFSNNAPLAHSVAFVPYAKRNSAGAIKPAFSGASSPNPTSGIAKGKTQKFSFVVKPVGTYAIICEVPGHTALGMWDVLKVVGSGSASIKFSK